MSVESLAMFGLDGLEHSSPEVRAASQHLLSFLYRSESYSRASRLLHLRSRIALVVSSFYTISAPSPGWCVACWRATPQTGGSSTEWCRSLRNFPPRTRDAGATATAAGATATNRRCRPSLLLQLSSEFVHTMFLLQFWRYILKTKQVYTALMQEVQIVYFSCNFFNMLIKIMFSCLNINYLYCI